MSGPWCQGRRPTRLPAGPLGLFVLLLVLPLLWACDGAYLFHAARGQLQRITDDVPIEEALKDPSLGDRELAHLNMIGPLKALRGGEAGAFPDGELRKPST